MLHPVALTTVTAGRPEWLSGARDGYLDFKSSASESGTCPTPSRSTTPASVARNACALVPSTSSKWCPGTAARRAKSPHLRAQRIVWAVSAAKPPAPQISSVFAFISGTKPVEAWACPTEFGSIPIRSARLSRVFLYVRHRCGDWFARRGTAAA